MYGTHMYDTHMYDTHMYDTHMYDTHMYDNTVCMTWLMCLNIYQNIHLHTWVVWHTCMILHVTHTCICHTWFKHTFTHIYICVSYDSRKYIWSTHDESFVFMHLSVHPVSYSLGSECMWCTHSRCTHDSRECMSCTHSRCTHDSREYVWCTHSRCTHYSRECMWRTHSRCTHDSREYISCRQWVHSRLPHVWCIKTNDPWLMGTCDVDSEYTYDWRMSDVSRRMTHDSWVHAM